MMIGTSLTAGRNPPAFLAGNGTKTPIVLGPKVHN